jgi:hypothetical protein
VLVRRQLRWCSAGVDVNAPAVHFDQECKRFAANPIGSALRLPRPQASLIKWHFAEKPIVRRGYHANFPRSDSSHVSGADCVARRCTNVQQPLDKIDTGCRRNDARPRF